MDEKALQKLEEAVYKSLKNKEVPPKRKHERNIILESWEERGASAIFMEIFRKPLKELSQWKSLIVIHKVLREGHPKALVDAHIRKSYFDTIRRQYHNWAGDFGRLVSGYATYLIAKIDFHHLHGEVDPSISLEVFLRNNPTITDPAKAFSLATHLIDLQQVLIDFEKSVFAQGELTECKVACFIPLVIESYAIYQLTVYLLKQLVKQSSNMDVFSYLTQRFYAQYIDLRTFYFGCSNIRYVTSIIAVPSLPQDPPKFENTTAGAPKRKKSPRAKVVEPAEPELEIEVPLPSQSMSQNNHDLFASFNQNAQYAQPQPAAQPQSYSSNPFFADSFSATSHQMAAPITPATAPALEAYGIEKSDVFADLLNVKPDPTLTAPPEPQVIVKNEIPADVQARLKHLEQRVAQLETENKKLKAENEALRRANNGLKVQVEKAASEKQQVLENQIGLSESALRSAMYKFDDPSFLGNQAAIAADLLEAAEKFKRTFSELVGAVKVDGNTVASSLAVADSLGHLLGEVKGFSQHIEDYNIKESLTTGARNTGELSSDFLGTTKELVGTVPDDTQKGYIDGQHEKVKAQVGAIIDAVNRTLAQEANKDDGIDLEGLAERELLKAAGMIEDAARQLELQNQKRIAARQGVPADELNVEESIMQAAMAITQATQALVRAATEAQSERIAKGKANPGAFRYHKDPMWLEGLISAARAVAEATRQLVHCANEAANGRLDEAALIASSRAVASATAQLVAATRAKSDPMSKTQGKLDAAAQAITKATAMLVAAAKKRDEEAQAEIILKSNNFAESVKAEIDQQTKILRLEKDLESARKQLFSMRKSKYDASRVENDAQPTRDMPAPNDGPLSPRDFAPDYVTASVVTPQTSTQVQVRDRSNSSLAPEQRRELQNMLQGALGGPRPAESSPRASQPPPQVPSLELNPFGFAAPAKPIQQDPQQPSQGSFSATNPFFS